MTTDLKFEDYLQSLKIQELLQDAGYTLNRRDGIKWLSYVRTDSMGKRISGDKFLVNPTTNTCCQPPAKKSYNIISFITSFPYLFKDNKAGMNPYNLVHKVCKRLMDVPDEVRQERRIDYSQTTKPFDIKDYNIHNFNPQDWETVKPFYPYFFHRGISYQTQKAFSPFFVLAEKPSVDGSYVFKNLSFPLTRPGEERIMGFEERGRSRLDGSSGYKGKAAGSDGSRSLWIANLSETSLTQAQNVYWFESAYDAMAFYQLHSDDMAVKKGVFVSTGGNPTSLQFREMMEACHNADHKLCFDVDTAGKEFARQFDLMAKEIDIKTREIPSSLKEYMTRATFRAEKEGEEISSYVYDPPKDIAQLLPPHLLKIYEDHRQERIKLAMMNKTGTVPDAEIFEQEKKTAALHSEFHKEINKILEAKEDVHRVTTTRLTPIEGYKDWNEELIGLSEEEKKEAPLHRSIDSGIDVDGDGINEQIEEDVPVDEKKHISKAR